MMSLAPPPAMPGGHRELRHRLREEERARGLHEGLRLRVLDRGRHPHPEEGGQVLQKGEEVLLGQGIISGGEGNSSDLVHFGRGCVKQAISLGTI